MATYRAPASDTVPTGTFTCRGPSARAFCFGVGVAAGECTDRFTLKIRSEMQYGVPAQAAMISMDPNFIDHGSAQMVGTQLNASFRFGRGRGRLLVHLNPRASDGTWRGAFEEVAYEGPRVRVTCELDPDDDQRDP